MAVAASMAQSPYISRVFDYTPAPGQFINENYPRVDEGDTYETILARVDSALTAAVGNTFDLSHLISLGAWGGSVTFGFDHDIANVEGQRDLIVYGNAFFSGQPKNGYQFASSEPGIIWVSADANGNGLPDDEWYEIAGSESANTIRNYSCTYHYSTDAILWEDNLGESGLINRNDYHTQETYYPSWISGSTYTIEGSILPPNLTEESGYRSFCFEYGYADNQPNDSLAAQIDLGWAINAEGQPANLTSIRFVRVQTGVQVDWGVSGEMSTEINGARDLHIGISALPTTKTDKGTQKYWHDGRIFILRDGTTYNLLGRIVR